MIDNETLLDLLSFEGVDSVDIISQTELKDGATHIVARLEYPGDELTVPFIHFDGADYIFSPIDWQASNSLEPGGIDSICWRINNTEQEAIVFDGLPRLAPWTPEPVDRIREIRRRIGVEIKEARTARNLTTRQLADMVDIAHSQIVRIEAGRLNARMETLIKILLALDIEITI